MDFFSLDIEGAELFVLKSIPWDKVNIKLVMIEKAHNVEEYVEWMKSVGYKEYKRLSTDIIFEKQ